MKQHAKWLELAATKNIMAADCATLCIYRAILKTDDVGQQTETAVTYLKRAFSPIASIVKLENGAEAYFSLKQALISLKYSNFFSALDPAVQGKISSLVKDIYGRF